MKKRLFAIPSLLAAGFLPVNAQAYPIKPTLDGDLGKTKSLFDIFKLDHIYTLAGHSSHSSHSSHVSHSSHRSSTGGYSYIPPSPSTAPSEPAPLYSAPSAPAPTYQAPAIAPAPAPLKTLPGNAYRFKEIVQQVEFALLAFGYYTGEIDGEMNSELRAGLQRMQSDYGLKVTGTITPETLTALRIEAR
ncbi:His-Xaa-Ser repeat protein HxsA [Mesorhizobium sp. M1A.F.Ca.ET.072.01.1.1]|uniref:His-Xaa-Ser repeat protein HxsA n=1 Tax=Mesorhizobium sp. M1A.F.Ca.ET.072.01.1.1 TaxID=2496753 RepID=UPI000FD20587|nr:His-Xaa-Ser repeat protein HxsA [Mesorhizobium sp. M1A.F.Ca.ET.072.01.1.1]RUW53634.1 His-Xaa-Ser repeat protein HxsA [Mesorhizobium sp. M1A.F.Ca.ET.072.01.1.1]TIV04394.1 MAG: His-Xaa-Ser repeat protein HxsA [Mesorhizobium sp.]